MDRSWRGSINKTTKHFLNYIEKSYQLPMLDHPDALWQTGVIINEAIQTSKTTSKPVHINFPFREPLYKTVPQAEKKLGKLTIVQIKKFQMIS